MSPRKKYVPNTVVEKYVTQSLYPAPSSRQLNLKGWYIDTV